MCVTNDYEYVPFVVITIWSFPRSWFLSGFVTRVTRRVPLVEQDLLTFSENLSSSLDFSVVRVAQYLVFYVVCCGSLSFRLFVLRFTASDYPFRIFKLFLSQLLIKQYIHFYQIYPILTVYLLLQIIISFWDLIICALFLPEVIYLLHNIEYWYLFYYLI